MTPPSETTSPETASAVTVEISNSYLCGRVSASTEHVRYPETGESLADWWDEVVEPLMGDNHSCASSEPGTYEAEITAAPDDPSLVGEYWSCGEG